MEALTIQITGFENVGRSHTNYLVSCSTGLSQWLVRKRYSEFQKLHVDLKACGRVAAQLPPKVLFGKLSDAVVSKRQDGLNDYLNRVHRGAGGDQRRVLASFLQVPSQRQAQGLQGEQLAVYDVPDMEPSDGAREEMVEQVADRMIDAFQAPVPVKGRDAKTRQDTYRQLLQKISWPSAEKASLVDHLKALLCVLPKSVEFPERASLSQGEGASPGPGRQEIEEARAQLSSTALSPQEDALLSSVLKQLTAATKAVQVSSKDPFVVWLGEIADEDA